jgi:ABC-type bacteriocin/lantibiotic exporter with double-glycine peptidase domain
LSGGQRQRLEIARAFARNPRLLIFDEAFSGLEADAAEAILQEVRDRRCAALLVTHRPEILQMADEVLVMKEGCIVERGKFTDLSKGSPFFKSLVGEI